MISVCIPIYNQDVTQLVSDLHEQCRVLVDYEIILIDDASEETFRSVNRNFLENINDSNIIYQELSSNIGRSAIRNRLARKASFPYLLYIDNDAKICSSHFITRYLIMRSPGIVCYGGCKYEDRPDNNELLLRWLYGIHKEAIAADIRQKSPNLFFSTFNFLVDKRIVLLYPFDESIREYGYEDILFKTEILKQGYSISQIENPLIHEGLISNKEFLERTEVALNNLNRIWKTETNRSEIISSIHILKTASCIEKWKLTSVVAWSYRLLKKLYLKNLLGKKPRLFLFDLYKLGYLCNLKTSDK